MDILLVEDDSLFASTFAEAMAVHGMRVHVEAATQAAILRLVGGAALGGSLLLPFLLLGGLIAVWLVAARSLAPWAGLVEDN